MIEYVWATMWLCGIVLFNELDLRVRRDQRLEERARRRREIKALERELRIGDPDRYADEVYDLDEGGVLTRPRITDADRDRVRDFMDARRYVLWETYARPQMIVPGAVYPVADDFYDPRYPGVSREMGRRLDRLSPARRKQMLRAIGRR